MRDPEKNVNQRCRLKEPEVGTQCSPFPKEDRGKLQNVGALAIAFHLTTNIPRSRKTSCVVRVTIDEVYLTEGSPPLEIQSPIEV